MFLPIPVLEIDHLTGGYSRKKPVLQDVTLHLNPAEMVGLIGLNGAGKSTTIKHILGLMTPLKGEIRMQGETLSGKRMKYRSAYAYVPETPVLYDELTVTEHLRMTAMAYDVSESDYKTRTARLAEQFQMNDKLDQFASFLSKGMRQKVMLMCAFLARPSLYIIDEPFVGLDPLGIRTLLDMLNEMRKEGASILMTSHILSMIENYCDRFVILHRGEIVEQGTLEQIILSAGNGTEHLEEAFYHTVLEGMERR